MKMAEKHHSVDRLLEVWGVCVGEFRVLEMVFFT